MLVYHVSRDLYLFLVLYLFSLSCVYIHNTYIHTYIHTYSEPPEREEEAKRLKLLSGAAKKVPAFQRPVMSPRSVCLSVCLKTRFIDACLPEAGHESKVCLSFCLS